jgi:opacity protein-like surface antigen
MLKTGRSRTIILSLFLIWYFPLAFSQGADDFELGFAVGSAWHYVRPAYTLVSPYITHKSITYWVPSAKTAGIYRAGIGYHFFREQLAQRAVLNDLFLQMNVYSHRVDFQGLVLQNGVPLPANRAFIAPLNHFRWMLDMKPGLFTVFRMTPYPILGSGIAWNRLAYHETFFPGVPWVSLKTKTNTQWAYDLGAGVSFQINKHLRFNAEYVYTNLYTLKPSKQIANLAATVVLHQPGFASYAQDLLFGLAWLF